MTAGAVKTVKQRVAELMSDGQARSARRIAYLINASYGTVTQLIREGLLVKIGEMHREHPFQRKGVPVVVSHPDSPQSAAFRRVAEEVARQVSIEAMKPELVVLKKSQ